MKLTQSLFKLSTKIFPMQLKTPGFLQDGVFLLIVGGPCPNFRPYYLLTCISTFTLYVGNLEEY